MHATGPALVKRLPHWLRFGMHVSIIVGIFAMHHMFVGQGGEAHHTDAAAVTMTADSASQPDNVPILINSDGDGHGTASDCCGLMMLCLAMVAGTSLFIAIRQRASDRVLWQLPPPSSLDFSLRVPPFNGLSPRQRSSVLRC